MMIYIGDTPSSNISAAHATGIHAVRHVMFAVFAILKHGAAMSATTAGRTPRKNFATYSLSLKFWKNIAITIIAIIDGSAMPIAPTMPPHTPRNL